MEAHLTPYSQNNLEKEQFWRSHISGFQNFLHKTTVIKQKRKSKTQNKTKQKLCDNGKTTDIKTDGMESPDINPCMFVQLIFAKVQDHPMREIFSTNANRETGYPNRKA